MGFLLTLLCISGPAVAMSNCVLHTPQTVIRPSANEYRRIRAEVESNLKLHILDKWFSRAVDWSRNGFCSITAKSAIVWLRKHAAVPA